MKLDASEVWKRYQNGSEHHSKTELYSKTEKAHKFYAGDQWYDTGNGKDLPVMNIIAPIVEYKAASVARNKVDIIYTPMNNDENRQLYQKLCDKLSDFTLRRWERANMDDICWKVVKRAAIAGDSYLYFPDDDTKPQIIDNVNIFFGDEQQPDIQKQPYIIIFERAPVETVKKIALKNGIDEKLIENIKGDDEKTSSLSLLSQSEVNGQDKCSCLLYMYKDEDGVVHVQRSTKSVIFSPDRPVAPADDSGNFHDGLTVYPVASFVWKQAYGSSRGWGEVIPLTANQVEINRTYARRAVAVKAAAYPKLIYDKGKIEEPETLMSAGASIGVENLQGNPVNSMVSYLTPAPISAQAERLAQELIDYTKSLAGAGDAVLGLINPEKASGTAILAVADQSQLPLNQQISAFRAFVEDVANIWYAMWCVYNPDGVTVTAGSGDMLYDIKVSPVLLKAMQVDIRTDVCSSTPVSKFAQQQAIDNLFASGAITFEEYVSLLDSGSVLPKSRLEELLNKRKGEQTV